MRPCQYLIMIPGRVLRYIDRFVCIPLWSLVSVGSEVSARKLER